LQSFIFGSWNKVKLKGLIPIQKNYGVTVGAVDGVVGAAAVGTATAVGVGAAFGKTGI
jgi:hypothetical protein